jgi:hypothetical protein
MLGISSARRTAAGLGSAMILLWVTACGGISAPGFSGDVDALLTRGDSYLTSLTNQPEETLDDAAVLALAYLERARLGLGSPFRLIEYALRDPDLPEEVRTPLAYGLLSRTLAGRTFQIDPQVLEAARLSGVQPVGSSAYQQLRLIERAVSAAPTAAAGERTVRLGYLLAAAERTVEPNAASVVAYVAAMLGDRRRSQEDAQSLLRSAVRYGEDPLDLLRRWRREAKFGVEQPALLGVSVREAEAEARDGPSLALALRTLAQRQSTGGTYVPPSGYPTLRDADPVLSVGLAERLGRLAAVRNYPVQAPIAVAIEMNREGLLNRPGLEVWQREARERFATEAWNEERLAAGAAILYASGAHVGQRAPLILLQAATFLRAWNQEDPWFPGDPAPSAKDLEGRFGLAAIHFDADVDESWRPYYLRMLGRGLSDLQRVLPTVSVRGLTIRIGELPGDTRALALHEPRTRTLYMPPRTSAGTLAHEIAHDVDWQLARRRYGARGGYGTDMAVRAQRGDRIAAAMMELSSSLVQPATEVPPTRHATRPAEVFARGMDWLVAAMLANDGRLGGYLTSFQDPVLTGYGTTRSPDIRGAAVPALLSILDGIAPVADHTREWVLETHGPGRSLSGLELVRAVSEAGSGLWLDQRLQQIHDLGRRSMQAVNECRSVSADGLRRLAAAQRGLAEETVRAASRGAIVDAARELAASREERESVDAWLAWRLYGAPEPLDPVLDELAPELDDLILRAELISRTPPTPVDRNAFHLDRAPTSCRGNPFATDTRVGGFGLR